MKKLIFLSLSLFLSVAISAQTHKTISTADFESIIKTEKGIVLDVRTVNEYNSGHIEGAENAVYSMFGFEDAIAKLDKNETYFIYCRSGARSNRALKVMKKQGFNTVYNLNGGILGWQRANLPVVQ